MENDEIQNFEEQVNDGVPVEKAEETVTAPIEPEEKVETSSVQEDYEETLEVKHEKDVRPTERRKITGWLRGFLIFIGLGGLFMAIMLLVLALDDSRNISYIPAIIGAVANIGLTVYAIYAMTKRKENAVHVAKSYLFFMVLYSLLLILNKGYGLIDTLFIVACGIWFWYLSVSKQLEVHVPSKFRRWLPRDKYVLGIAFIAFLCISGLMNPFSNTDGTYEQQEGVESGEGQTRDGLIKVSVPEGYDCNYNKENDFFRLYMNEGAQVALVHSEEADNFSMDDFVEGLVSYAPDSTCIQKAQELEPEQVSYASGQGYSMTITLEDSYWVFIMIYNEDANCQVIISEWNKEGSKSVAEEIASNIKYM